MLITFLSIAADVQQMYTVIVHMQTRFSCLTTTEMRISKMTTIDYANTLARTMMQKFDAPSLPPTGRFHYHAGVFLSGMEQLYLLTGDEQYNVYIKKFIDTYVDADGNISGVDEGTLDDIEPCNLMFRYIADGEERYLKPLGKLVNLMKHWECTPEGGFWHKIPYCPNQMWLDGLYMGSPLMIKYGLLTHDDEFIKLAHKQLMLMWDNMRDEKTGLLYHAWDTSKKAEWSDPTTGLSSFFWGRAIGWYAVASADIYDLLPADNKYREDFGKCAVSLCKALLKYQDTNSGLWYQVVDKGDDPNNWTETSCSCLFLYSISKLIRMNLLDKKYADNVRRAFEGVIKYKTEFHGDDMIIKDICIGTGVCDYDGYLARPRTENDLHGTGAFLLASTEYARLEKYIKENKK